jgi:PhzF family phenazine biosynthesis protein
MDIWTVDTFTGTHFKGNPAGVAFVEAFPSDEKMIAIAAKMAHSETRFLKKLGENSYHIRWFTPYVEVKLCGHATLAAAFVLKECMGVVSETLVFECLSGQLSINNTEDRMKMEFPATSIKEVSIVPAIGAALGDLSVKSAVMGPDDDSFLVYRYESQSVIEALTPNFDLLKSATPNAVVVTAPGDGDYDYALRVFAPQYGVNEDPVTGSAQLVLAAYWEAELKKFTFKVIQVSDRAGELVVERLEGSVAISGAAVIASKLKLD